MSYAARKKITHSLLKQLQKQGYQAPDNIVGDGRNSLEEVILKRQFLRALRRTNPGFSPNTYMQILDTVENLATTDLLACNEAFHRMLTYGVPITLQKGQEQRGDLLWLIDFTTPWKNDFSVMSPFLVKNNTSYKRFDVVLFINGIPLVLVELETRNRNSLALQASYLQLQSYQEELKTLFAYNSLLVISNGVEAKIGTIGSDFSRFITWKSKSTEELQTTPANPLKSLVRGALEQTTLLDLIQNFIVFETKGENYTADHIGNNRTHKKIAAYYQYYAVNKATASCRRASGFLSEKPSLNQALQIHSSRQYGFIPQIKSPYCNQKAGIIWHTQGSGKSLSMIFLTAKLIQILNNPSIVILTDRNDLDEQLFACFVACRQILRQLPKQAQSRKHLQKLLQVASGGITLTTIHKFYPTQGNQLECLSKRRNIIVIADEAHRSHYGFHGRTIYTKDSQGNTTSNVSYGFAKYLRDALPCATFIGFTATPIESKDINTPAVFGDYIDIYDVSKSISDGTTVPIYYENRAAHIPLAAPTRELDQLSNNTANLTFKTFVGETERMRKIAKDILTHFYHRKEVMQGKGMIVCASRKIAVSLYQEIISLRPSWHSNDFRKGQIKVVITVGKNDSPEITKHRSNKLERKLLASRMRTPNDELALVIVCDMWLTGFDSPCLHTMYIDKPMQGHNLMQAITRVNRIFQDKPAGLIVDYLGISNDLQETLTFYTKQNKNNNFAFEQEQAVAHFLQEREIVHDLLQGFPWQDKDPQQILPAQEFILSLENGRTRFLQTMLALSKAYSLATPHPTVLAYREEIAFLETLKFRLVALSAPQGSPKRPSQNHVIQQLVRQTLAQENNLDIFATVATDKPYELLLSQDVLHKLSTMEHTNLALEVLHTILQQEIASYTTLYVYQGKSLAKALKTCINKYYEQTTTAKKTLGELLLLADKLNNFSKQAAKMQISTWEYALYVVILSPTSSDRVVSQDLAKKLAILLTEKIKENTKQNWLYKENVRAKLRVTIKRTLRKFDYPLHQKQSCLTSIIQQVERIAERLAIENESNRSKNPHV
ncbi:MAG: type I restriction endonuclease subunit R [Spirochaetota bacterium]